LKDERQAPALIARLRAARGMSSAPRDSEQWAYVESLLDALIRLQSPVPTEVLLPFRRSFRAEVLTLLIRNHRDEQALLAMREEPMTDPDWAVVNDLLFREGSPEFFQKTLEEIHVTHFFRVNNHEALYGGTPMGCAVLRRKMPRGFPPLALYQFTTGWGDKILIEGPVPVYLSRIDAASDGEARWSECEYRKDMRDWMRGKWLGALGGLNSEKNNLFQAANTVVRFDAAGASAEIERLLTEQASSIQALIEEAQRRGFLHASGMKIPIAVKVEDIRSSWDEEIPPPAAHVIAIP
jgi:hypothetical protein